MRHVLCIINILISASVSTADICSHLPGYAVHATSCFKFENIAKSWNDAEAACVADGGHLASIHSSEEQAFVSDLISSTPYPGPWIGLTGIRPTMAWSDGTDMDYTNWHQTTPERQALHSCTKLNKNSYLWRDVWCFNAVTYICRVDMVVDPRQGFFTKIQGGVPVDSAVVPLSSQWVQSVDECALRCQPDIKCAHFTVSEDGGKYLCETYVSQKRRPTNATIIGNYQRIL